MHAAKSSPARYRRATPILRPPTPRQEQLILLTWAGFSMIQTAAVLGISVDTVHATRQQMYRRMGIRGSDPRTRAALWLWKHVREERTQCSKTNR